MSDERVQDVRELAWRWAEGITAGESPDSLAAAGAPPEQVRAAFLVRLAALKQVAGACETAVAQDVAAALARDADFKEIGEAWGVSWQAASKRWGHLVSAGERVAVTISRRNRIHHDAVDPRGVYGEVGGAAQYDSDRGAWPVGEDVRANADYAIVAVEGVVARVYRLDRDGWEPDGKKWHFTGTLLGPEEIAAAHAAGDLPLRPGDPLPTRPGRAYWPYKF